MGVGGGESRSEATNQASTGGRGPWCWLRLLARAQGGKVGEEEVARVVEVMDSATLDQRW
jgi:hypothetical protein